MLEFAKRYNDKFRVEGVEDIFKKLLFSFMLTLPHIITALILIVFSPSKWLGIIFIGIILPDLYYIVHHIYMKLFSSNEDQTFNMIHISIKTISHIMVYIIVLFLFFNKEYVLALSGGLHILEDVLGF